MAQLAGVLLASGVLMSAGAAIGWRIRTDTWHVVAAGLIVVFGAAMVWVGTLLGMLVRAPDAASGVIFITVFPLSFLSNAFVPIETLPTVLEWIAAWNPLSAVVAALRELFGNPATPTTNDAWPIQHPVAAAWCYSIMLLALAIPAAMRRFHTRTAE